MSDKSEIPVENSNEWINWIEEAISKRHAKYYDYKDFHNLQKIGSGLLEKFIVQIGKIQKFILH